MASKMQPKWGKNHNSSTYNIGSPSRQIIRGCQHKTGEWVGINGEDLGAEHLRNTSHREIEGNKDREYMATKMVLHTHHNSRNDIPWSTIRVGLHSQPKPINAFQRITIR